MLLESFIPQLPTTSIDIAVYVCAYIGIVLLVYATFIEKEHRQDIVRALGAAGMFVYAVHIQNLIFSIAMAAVTCAALIEFIEIMLGLHKNSPEQLQQYKSRWRIKKK
ncbi:MAG: hypothetical protein CL685_03735 [Candidatus Magasanikbacteria bacterium]|nr:hypothetical protein [Candidatus Magasanikbacteria bacterium]|tara:strand:+ start:684 stop:1007 length:324 start_codon:yes stop_codon:yes gene_type:complete